MMSNYVLKGAIPFLCIIGFGLGSATLAAEEMFDTDTQTLLQDTDGDGYPDKTEQIGGTDPFDATDYPGSGDTQTTSPQSVSKGGSLISPSNVAGFPTSSCRPGFRQAGARLCISTNVQNADRFDQAVHFCRDQRARVATYGDLFYLYVHSGLDATYNPNGKWIGNIVGDDDVFVGNRSITFNNDPDMWNFEGVGKKWDSRNYWCAHDDEL